MSDMSQEEIEKKIRVEFARSGGKTTLKKYGKEHYRELQRKGVEARKKHAIDNKS